MLLSKQSFIDTHEVERLHLPTLEMAVNLGGMSWVIGCWRGAVV